MEILLKNKNKAKKAAVFFGLFLATLGAIFLLVNWNLDYDQKETTQESILESLNSQEKIWDNLSLTQEQIDDFSKWAEGYELTEKTETALKNGDVDQDGLSNYLEFVHLTNPRNPDTDGDGYSDQQEIINGYDPDAPGDTKPQVEIEIAKIAVTAPMVWSQSTEEKAMLADLENGLSHYPKTASPGQIGNAVISGHSSNYIWAKGEYNHIFSRLNDLAVGDEIKVKFTQNNGRVFSYKFQVSEKFVSTADDERIFAETDSPTLTLTTCWPIGTNLKRAIIKAQLVK